MIHSPPLNLYGQYVLSCAGRRGTIVGELRSGRDSRSTIAGLGAPLTGQLICTSSSMKRMR